MSKVLAVGKLNVIFVIQLFVFVNPFDNIPDGKIAAVPSVHFSNGSPFLSLFAGAQLFQLMRWIQRGRQRLH